ncbi:hypothetical protein [Nannocystis punicea]|uniref:HEAT repeat domain-containing protein n=1 Tax=Nannocystis punicea TaxID=2995304 RepID=A0ABY7H9Q8_9BACT|nr:hypothetical protein [Nannocystis poenicansa]WAS96012.1 hypothetical protein O0S08_07585 [Nannocystis poenicansa]
MTSANMAIAKFERLVQDLFDQFPDSPLVAGTMESGLSAILELIQDNPGERPEFARCFIDMLVGERPSPEWLIAYCMRTLRWPEVLRAAEDALASGDPYALSLAAEVFDAYEEDDEWVGAHLFARYAESDGGGRGEPGP